jgi:acyl carrier protein
MSAHEDGVLEIFRSALDIEVPDPETDVIETGLLDSLGLVVLVTELEQRFNVRIPFETLEIERFRTVRSIASLVEAEQKEAAS